MKTQKLGEDYSTPIKGFGEVYEIISVNHLRRKLLRIHPPNSILNLTHYEPEKTLSEIFGKNTMGPKLLGFGYADCPPWKSKPKEGGKAPSIPLTILSIPIMYLLLPFERFNKPHMVYILNKGET